MEHKKNTKSFASRWGFILASVGSAVGMANVWGFPNKMGSNGGGAFLLIYLLFVFIFSYVGLPAEFAMGRRAATGTLGAYENAWDTRSKSAGKVGGLLGWLPLAGSLCIAIGYAVIVTYVLKALVDSLLGTLLTTDTAAWFGAFSSTPYSVIPYHIVVVVGTLLTLFLGARSIEKTNKVMMPVFFVIFLILAVRVALKWYDEAEFNALVDRLIVPADGRNREELAQSWLDAVGDVTIHQVTPGSKYENSFVQNRVTVESSEPAAGLYDPELLAGQHFTFTNERIFVPGNYRSKEQQTVNSSARAYHGEYGPMPGGGAFLDTRSGLLYQTADGWKGTFAP